MKQDHQDLREKWRQDRARDASREATMDEQRLRHWKRKVRQQIMT